MVPPLSFYPTVQAQVKAMWDHIETSEFEDERDIKTGFIMLLRALTVVSEEKARLTMLLREKYHQETPQQFENQVRSMVLKGMAQDERKKYLLLSQSLEVRDATLKIQELDDYLDECKRVESILKNILECIRIQLKLSFEGHE